MSGSQYKYLPRPENASTMAPSDARSLFRKNGYYGTTSGFCQSYDQVNVLVLPVELADDFEEFCKKNSTALPLIYRSKPGEVGAPPLAADSDIKTDLPRYFIFSHGRFMEDALDLSGFEQSWGDRVTFYTGCSFTFEHVLATNGIKVAHMMAGTKVPLYKTTIQMFGVNSFGGEMIVSMRPIDKEQLAKTFQLSSEYPHHHGAPIHIGDPSRIGIADFMKPLLGDPPVNALSENKVPTFWACGASAQEAVATAKPQLAFSQCNDSAAMFITDCKSKAAVSSPSVEVCQLSRDGEPYFASVIEEKAKDLFLSLETAILDDPNGRGVQHLYNQLELLKATLSLSHSNKVAIVTGFPVNLDFPVKEETDGLPGALSICQALLALGKETTLISDDTSLALYESCVDHALSIGALKTKIPVISCEKAIKVYESSSSKEHPSFDCLVAIERAGKSKDGTYRSMKAVDVTPHVSPIDDLFVAASKNPRVKTICIGDGGNELGMGKVYSQVVNNIPNGQTIACSTVTDFVIAAGVSNWGGYALSAGLYLASSSPTHWRYRNQGINADSPPPLRVADFLPTPEQTTSLLKHMNSLGVRDGMTKGLDQSVDGLSLQTNLEKLLEISQVAKRD